MSGLTALGWPSLEIVEAALSSPVPRRWGLLLNRPLTLVAEPDSGSIWIDHPTGHESPPTTIGTTVIVIRSRTEGGNHHVQVGGGSRPLLKNIYYFLSSVVGRLHESTEDFTSVVRGELTAWERLLRPPSALDEDAQVGLLGELWILCRLIHIHGSSALDCWTGPLREPHDFRLAFADIEAKTTISTSRDHVISGLNQLVAIPNRRLFLLSIQLQPAGGSAGMTLANAVDRTLQRLSGNSLSTQRLWEILDRVQYREADRHLYTQSYRLRSAPVLAEVNEAFPSLTINLLSRVIPVDSIQRFRKVEYQVNVDGLGENVDRQQAIPELNRGSAADLYD